MSTQKLWTVSSLVSKFGSRAEQQWFSGLAVKTGQASLGVRSLSSPAVSGHSLSLKRSVVAGPLNGSRFREICLFSTSNNNKKTASNSEPHINDAKARPAEQGLRLDDVPTDNQPRTLPDSELLEAELRLELSKAVSENASLLAKSRDFEDKYLRALAETENVRTRLTKQISDAKLFAIQGFCKDLTDIEDILRLAIESVPKDQITAENKHLQQLYEGVKMTDARMLQVFKRHGLTQINPIDAKFNPNEHEAVVQQEVPGKESGTVIFVSKMGYKLNDRVIRPAVVGVAK